MRFTLLGTVAAWEGDRPIDLGPARQRCVLAALLVEPGRRVPIEVLIDRVWGADPPAAVRSALYSYITRLRRALRPVVIDRSDAGYQLCVPADAVDLWRWEQLLAAGQLGEALDLWQGRPLDGLDGRWVDQVRDSSERQYVDALAGWAELTSRAGRPEEAARRLAGPVSARPGAESLVAARMRALHLAGRTAEALDCYARTREYTVSELGAEPGQLLRELHLELLRAEPDRPAQLPAAVPDFTGRQEAIRRLDDLSSMPAVVITALAGTAGVGKTSLAVHWAHRVADRFGDGQLFVNLNGYAPVPPVEPSRALELMLQALGVPGDQIPADLEARVGMYRTRLAGKRMLVVLDNANSPDQVRPLLPGKPGCLVLITSRDSLAGLVALDGARRIDLDVLDAREALALLAKLLGADRVRSETPAAAQLAELCARLPLALRIAAANVGGRRIADYVETLAGDRLRELAVEGDPHAVVAAHFDYSYRHLGASERRLFRLFGYLSGIDVSAYAAAALLGTSLTEAGRLLGRLAEAHLVEERLPGRFGCHDLLRAYAGQHEDPDRDAALSRLFDWYLHTATVAMDKLDIQRRRLPEEPAVVSTPVPELADYEQAMAWLETERSNLRAVTEATADRGFHSYTWRIPHTLWRFFLVRSYVPDWQRTHELALAAARQLGDRWAEAETLNNLGTAFRRAGRNPPALEYHWQALARFRQIGDPTGAAIALANMGVIRQRLGEYLRSIDDFQEALAIFEEVGDRRLQANTLGNLSVGYEELGRYPEALTHGRRSLELFREAGDTRGESVCLANLGIVHQRLGQFSEALDLQREALDIARAFGDRHGVAAGLANIGETLCRLGRYAEALDHQHQALAIARDMGDADQEGETLNDIGQTHRAAGQHAEALARHREAMPLAVESGSRHQQARAHHGIARALHATGQPAREHWQRALDLFTDLGMADADQLRKELAGIDGS